MDTLAEGNKSTPWSYVSLMTTAVLFSLSFFSVLNYWFVILMLLATSTGPFPLIWWHLPLYYNSLTIMAWTHSCWFGFSYLITQTGWTSVRLCSEDTVLWSFVVLEKISLNSVVTCLVLVAGSHPEHFANPAVLTVWRKKWPFVLLTFPWPHGCFLSSSFCLNAARVFKFTAIVSTAYLLASPGKIDWTLFRFPEYLCRFDNYLFRFATGGSQLFPLPPLWLLFITTLSAAVPLSALGLWCNVNNMQKTVWSIPNNAVTRLLWVFYCVVTCIVLSILSWKPA